MSVSFQPVPRAGAKGSEGANSEDLVPDAKRLRLALRGALLTPSNEVYEAARRVYNAAIDKRPRFIAQARGMPMNPFSIAAVLFDGSRIRFWIALTRAIAVVCRRGRRRHVRQLRARERPAAGRARRRALGGRALLG